MHVKKNDTVTIIRGADKGKSGKILEVFPSENLVIVEGVGIRKRHIKPRRNGAKGQVVDRPMPISGSNVRLASAKK